MKHVVKKQIIEFTMTDSENAFHLQSEMSNFYWKKIVPGLEAIFDQLSGDDEFIQIDKLEVDLGLINELQISSSQNFTDNFSAIFSKIKEEVQLQLNNKRQDSVPGPVGQWLYYMEKGYLNWNALKIDSTWRLKVLEALATDHAAISSLRKLINQNKNALQRISNSHNEVFLNQIIEVLTTEKQDHLIQFITELCEFIKNISLKNINLSFNSNIVRKSIWAKAISIAADKKVGFREMAAEITGWLMKDEMEPAWRKIAKRHSLHTLFDVIKEKRIQREKDLKAPKKVKPEQIIPDEILNKILETEKIKSLQDDEAVFGDGIFVDNAGVVLLHPFLCSFFARLNLTDENNFVDEPHKAFSLLHYLATGNEEAEEYELVIPKFLLGYSIQDTISPVTLSPEEKEEAGYLLEAVIEKWNILGNTSVSALRENFLQRKGKLYTKNENYYLHIESSSIDMLLDHLPWNLSIIKLPWMKEILRVEWR